MLTVIRKGLQNQLITCALQRIHAFLELSPTQLSQLAETFSQTVYAKGMSWLNTDFQFSSSIFHSHSRLLICTHKHGPSSKVPICPWFTGKEITRIGDMNGSAARIFVVQRGTVSLYKLPSSDEKLDKSETSSRERDGGSTTSSSSSAGNKHNSVLKGSSGSSIITSGSEKGSGGGRQQSHLKSNKLGSGSSTQEDLKPTREVKSAVAAPASVPAPSAASTKSTLTQSSESQTRASASGKAVQQQPTDKTRSNISQTSMWVLCSFRFSCQSFPTASPTLRNSEED